MARLLRNRTPKTYSVREQSSASPIEAAVLIPLHVVEPDGPLHLWLCKRPDSMRTHAGQIAFPGGRKDPEDIDSAATALREAREEIGLRESQVTMIAPFDELTTPSGYRIRSHVALVDPLFVPEPNPAEVELVFRAPLITFTTEPRGEFPRIGYDIESQFVWGATFYMARALALTIQAMGAEAGLL